MPEKFFFLIINNINPNLVEINESNLFFLSSIDVIIIFFI